MKMFQIEHISTGDIYDVYGTKFGTPECPRTEFLIWKGGEWFLAEARFYRPYRNICTLKSIEEAKRRGRS